MDKKVIIIIIVVVVVVGLVCCCISSGGAAFFMSKKSQNTSTSSASGQPQSIQARVNPNSSPTRTLSPEENKAYAYENNFRKMTGKSQLTVPQWLALNKLS